MLEILKIINEVEETKVETKDLILKDLLNIFSTKTKVNLIFDDSEYTANILSIYDTVDLSYEVLYANILNGVLQVRLLGDAL